MPDKPEQNFIYCNLYIYRNALNCPNNAHQLAVIFRRLLEHSILATVNGSFWRFCSENINNKIYISRILIISNANFGTWPSINMNMSDMYN